MARSMAQPVRRLLDLDDHALDAAVSNRIRQLMVEGRPRWNLYRSVLAGVRPALSDRVVPPPALPTRIQEPGEAGRLDGKQIARAVAEWHQRAAQCREKFLAETR